jgi:tRNA modification GTPase
MFRSNRVRRYKSSVKRSCEADLRITLFPSEWHYDINCIVINSDTIYVLSSANDAASEKNILTGSVDSLPISILKGIGTERLISMIKRGSRGKIWP